MRIRKNPREIAWNKMMADLAIAGLDRKTQRGFIASAIATMLPGADEAQVETIYANVVAAMSDQEAADIFYMALLFATQHANDPDLAKLAQRARLVIWQDQVRRGAVPPVDNNAE